MTINDLVGDNLPGFVWKLQDQISQAARKYEGVLIGACTSFHHQTFFISVVEGCLGGRFVVVAWERLGFQIIQGRHVAVQEGDINMDQGVFNNGAAGCWATAHWGKFVGCCLQLITYGQFLAHRRCTYKVACKL